MTYRHQPQPVCMYQQGRLMVEQGLIGPLLAQPSLEWISKHHLPLHKGFRALKEPFIIHMHDKEHEAFCDAWLS